MSGLRDAFDDIVADVPVYGDIERAIEQADRERRRRYGALAGLAAAAAVVAVVLGMVAGSRDGNGSPEPVSPVTTPTPSEDTTTPSRPRPATQWEGALRDDQQSLPVVPLGGGRSDGPDADVGGVDIRRVTASRRPEWRLQLGAAPLLASTLDPADRIMEHGVVVDGDGDRLADCHIAISTDAPTPGDLRVSVTDLKTGVTSEQVGPPYGIPIDFFHPAEGEDPGQDGAVARTVIFFFLSGEGASCAPFGGSAAFYTYAALLEGGLPTSIDYAPDAAWLKMPG